MSNQFFKKSRIWFTAYPIPIVLSLKQVGVGQCDSIRCSCFDKKSAPLTRCLFHNPEVLSNLTITPGIFSAMTHRCLSEIWDIVLTIRYRPEYTDAHVGLLRFLPWKPPQFWVLGVNFPFFLLGINRYMICNCDIMGAGLNDPGKGWISIEMLEDPD